MLILSLLLIFGIVVFLGVVFVVSKLGWKGYFCVRIFCFWFDVRIMVCVVFCESLEVFVLVVEKVGFGGVGFDVSVV